MTRVLTCLLLALCASLGSLAQDCFLGEVTLFSGNFAPNGWSFCDGSTLTVQQNSALFAILGYAYGGNTNTFNLPDFRGVFPIGASTTTGGSAPQRGARVAQSPPSTIRGSATGTLLSQNIPPHSHEAVFTGTSSTTNFDTTLSVAQAAGQSAAQAGGSLSQGANSGTGAANILQPPGSTSGARVALNGGSGSITSTPAGTVQVSDSVPGEGLRPVILTVGGTADTVLPPYLAMNYIICTTGLFPSRS